MTSVIAESISLSYPIFGIQARSFKHSLLKMTVGGNLKRGNHSILVDALDNISFSLKGGDQLALVGHNGSGKSTLLRVLAGVYETDEGTLKTEGSISSMLDLQLGMDHEATGYENVKIRLLLLDIPKKEWHRYIKDVEEFTELGDFLNMPIRTYSSGMMVRLAFALSTMVVPDILLIDEVIGAGDANFREKANHRMKTTAQESEILVIASHDPGTLQKFCNTAIWLEKGKIKSSGKIDNVLDEYKKSN